MGQSRAESVRKKARESVGREARTSGIELKDHTPRPCFALRTRDFGSFLPDARMLFSLAVVTFRYNERAGVGSDRPETLAPAIALNATPLRESNHGI